MAIQEEALALGLLRPGGADPAAPHRASIPTAAPRPAYSVLDKTRDLGGARLPRARTGGSNLRHMLQELARA